MLPLIGFPLKRFKWKPNLKTSVKLTKKAEYCVRAMLDMAMQGEGQLVLVKDIARRQEISERFLEHVMTTLKNAGLVTSSRGARGGFALARKPSEIKLLDILRVSIGDLCWSNCVHDPASCSRSATCVARDIWTEFGQVIENMAGALSLAQIVERQHAKLFNDGYMYQI